MMWPVGLVLLAACLPAFADDAPPLHQQIDRLIAASTENYAGIAAPIADDAEFLRRVSLDLVGTIPTVETLTR
jgi:hypothetical protein